MTTTIIEDWTELASRECDGLAISLLWSRAADRVTVAVVDEKLEEEFYLDVPSTCALDAYYHPFAYAAGRGHYFGGALREGSSAVTTPERSVSR